MSDNYQSPEPGWKSDVAALSRDVADLRKEVKLGTKLVIWGFSISWVAVLAMYVGGFAFYLPATIKPLDDRLSKIDGIDGKLDKIDGKMEAIKDQLRDLKVDVSKIGVKRATAPVTERPAANRQNGISGTTSVVTQSSGGCRLVKGEYDFGTVSLGRDQPLAIIVQHPGNALVLGEAGIGGPAGAEFSLTENKCVGSIGSAKDCKLVIVFSPRQVGVREATLNFVCDSIYPIAAKLTGIGSDGGP
jgi:hypothetical protein